MATQRSIDVGALIERKTFSPLQVSVVALLCLLMSLEGYDMQALAFAAPAIMKEWGTDRAAFGWVLSASLFGYLIGALVLTQFSDTIGRKKLLIAGTLVFSLLTLATAFASSPMEIWGLRFFAGMGLGGTIPTCIALVAEYVPARKRGLIIGLLFAGYTLGSALGGFLAAWMVPTFGWHTVFLVGGLAPLPIIACIALFLPESIRFLIVSNAPHARISAIVRRLGHDTPLTGDEHFIVQEETKQKVPVVGLFSNGRSAMTALLWFAFIASFMGHHFLTTWLPTLMTDAGLSIAWATSVGAVFQLGGTVGSLVVGMMLDRWGIRTVAATFIFAGLFVAPLGLLTGAGPALLLLAFIAGLCVLGGQNGLNALSGSLYPTSMRASGAGWALGVGRIGAAAGPIIGGHLMNAGVSHASLFVLASIPLVICACALLALVGTTRRAQAHETRATVPAGRQFAR